MHAVPTIMDYLNDFDYSFLLIGILINLGTRVVANEMILKKEFNGKVKNIVIPPNVKDENVSITDDEIKEKYGDTVLHFKHVLEGELKPKNLTLFYNNIASLKIDFNAKNKKSKGDYITYANYDMSKNSINIYQKDEINLYHELLHVSSCLNSSFNGFYQSQNGVGRGINEGYTQLLCERYFKEAKSNGAYLLEKHIASNLEMIVGQEKMEDFYFSSDLYSLYKELKNYISKEEILDFFKTLDFVNSFIGKPMLSLTMESRLDRCIKKIYYLLGKMYIIKCKNDYANGTISIFDKYNRINKYLMGLNIIIYNKYKAFDEKSLKKLHNDYEYLIPTKVN